MVWRGQQRECDRRDETTVAGIANF